MTARPMTETCPKLREAIENGHLRCSVSVGVGSPVATIDTVDLWRLVHAAERSLSTSSAAVRGMREALEFYADDKRYRGPNQNNPGNDPYTPSDAPYLTDVTRDSGARALAALSGIEGEDEQATRASGPTAPTDRL